MEGSWAEKFPLLATFVDYDKKGFLLATFQAKSLVPSRFTFLG